MGILNVTPDSFSDGGRFLDTASAIERGVAMAARGADVIDIGGESTRPGAAAVPVDEELARVVPVIQALAQKISIPLSIDTSKAEVARRGLAAGAEIINDVTALSGDPGMAKVVRDAGAGVILMHMQGTPQIMQIQPHYADVVAEVVRYLQERLQFAESAGIAPARIALDPGIGFGKTAAHNIELLAHLDQIAQLGRPVCLGVSRKGFVGKLLGDRPVDKRLAGSLAALCYTMARDAVHIIRVHDVEETKDCVGMFTTLRDCRQGHVRSARLESGEARIDRPDSATD
jgi:dihydropteroate synthase